MKKSAVTIEVAQVAMDKWLNYKRVGERKRDSNADSIEVMMDGFEDGSLTLNEETHEITHTLCFPLGENEAVKQLTYKPRVSVGVLQSYLTKTKSGDADGRVTAYVQALTGQTSNIIKGLDTEDNRIAQAIALFFF